MDPKLINKKMKQSMRKTIMKFVLKIIKIMFKIIITLLLISAYILFVLILSFQFISAGYWDRLLHRLPGSFRNEDTNRNIYELIESRGFRYEQHYVRTNDGYILQLVRLVNPYVIDRSQLKPILLHHGFQCTGTLWLLARNGTLLSNGVYYEYADSDSAAFTGQRFSNGSVNEEYVADTLGFVLATKGYDVWLANYRGSIYSTNHTTLDTNSDEFWRFSIDEMILYDLPAQIDYILANTHRTHLSYIGHSQGNLMMFGLMSQSDYYTKRIRPFIALSPVFYHDGSIRSGITRFIPFINYLRSNPTRVPFSDGAKSFFSNICENHLTQRLCFMTYYDFTGTILDNIDWKRLTVFTSNIGMGSSAWNAAHLLQLYSRNDGNFSSFDMNDADENYARYGQTQPSIYDARNINSKHIAIIYTENDWFNSLEQIYRLRRTLPNPLIDDYLVPIQSYSHIDLLWGYNVGYLVNWRIMSILNRYND